MKDDKRLGRAIHQEALLKALAPGLCLTIDQLEGSGGLSRRQITNAAMGLIRRALVERVELGCFRLTAEGITLRAAGTPLTSGPNAPHTGQRRTRKPNFRTRIWRAMAVRDKFAIGDLVAVAARGEERDPMSNAGRYLAALANAGYIRRLPVKGRGTALTSNGFVRYVRLRHTGPSAPIVKTGGKAVYDPNTRETVSWA